MNVRRFARLGLTLGVFAVGFVSGALAGSPARADWKQLGSDVMNQAAQQGGAIGTVAQLGTSIADMEQHLGAMQKNIETLKKVKSALGG